MKQDLWLEKEITEWDLSTCLTALLSWGVYGDTDNFNICKILHDSKPPLNLKWLYKMTSCYLIKNLIN